LLNQRPLVTGQCLQQRLTYRLSGARVMRKRPA
jgi:hypothetical protein